MGRVLANRNAVRGVPALLCCLALAACGGDSDGGTFDESELPFTFEYPAGFGIAENVSIDQQLGATADAQGGVGIDEDNAIIAQLFTLNIEIDDSNLDLARREIERLIGGVDESATLRDSSVAGLPALTAEEVAVPELENATSRLTFIFNGKQEYLINCQSTPDYRDEVDEACDQALETFELK